MSNTNFEKAFKDVQELAKSFQDNFDYYKQSTYQEAEVRKDFIDPFFIALGWDVNHDLQKNPYKQEVKVEKSQTQVGGAGKKFADYAFYLEPNYKDPMFYVEAKKPSLLLEDNLDYYLQTHKYGWNSQTPLAILTDFEEFIILDCRDKPHPKHSSNIALRKYNFVDYLVEEKFAEIYWVFSREAIDNKGIESFIESVAPKKKGKVRQGKLFGGGYKPVDHDFLGYIDELRQQLAQEFYLKDKSLNERELTEAAQKTIDRLIFMRFLEDKQIEHEDHVYHINDWTHFISLSKTMDNKYNGVVFKPGFIDSTRFKGISKSVFRDICIDISAKESPYNFNAIPVHILGSIYERFLGKVVTISGDKVSIDLKLELKKSGGVFYTPKFIVDYIVDDTIGSLISGKTPKEIDKLRFSDIACGSGSFLIGVYDFLVDYHKDYYQSKHQGKTEIDGRSEDFDDVVFKDGGWRITLKRKQEILLNCVFGLDIDNQAVEVTQLSLFLKLLEEESLSTTSDQYSMFSKVLPDLTSNIVCGNSLIGWDIEDKEWMAKEDITKVNPLSFESVFPEIMHDGGFNAIVGNPPWVDIKGLDPNHVKYYFERYDTTENRMNIYATFIHRALGKIAPKGRLGYIIPSSILYQSSYAKLRNKILKEGNLYKVIKTPDNIFEGVVCETAVLCVEMLKKTKPVCECIVYKANQEIRVVETSEAYLTKNDYPAKWLQNPSAVFDIYNNDISNDILKVIRTHKASLVDVADFCLGLTPYDKAKGHSKSQIENKVFHSSSKKDDTFKKLLTGGDVKPYQVEWPGDSYISYGDWLGAPRDSRFFRQDRVLVRQIASGTPPRIYSAFTSKELYNPQSIFNVVPIKGKGYGIKLISAILNSKLINFYHTFTYLDITKITFQKVLIQNAKQFPVPDIAGSAKKDLVKSIVSDVDKLVEAIRKMNNSSTESDINLYTRRINDIERMIDQGVCQLYGVDMKVLNEAWSYFFSNNKKV